MILGLRVLLAALALAAPADPRAGSFHYNENGGFGFYQPEGWRVEIAGRSSRLTGPEREAERSEIFAGSDWIAKVHSLPNLRAFVAAAWPGAEIRSVQVGEVAGYEAKTGPGRGARYYFREDQNVVELFYALRGSAAQRAEGEEALGSFQIRTGGIAYP